MKTRFDCSLKSLTMH